MSNPILNIIAFIVVLGVMVLVHELGHFIMAKRAGIKVEEFGFGYPPRLVGLRRGETVYSINLIPIGGFVRMLGEEDPSEQRSFARTSKRWRVAVLLAGPAMNLILAVVLFGSSFVAGWPTPTANDVVIASVQPGSPAEAAGMRADDVVTGVAGKPVGTMQDLRSAAQSSAGRGMALTVRRDGVPVTVTIVPRDEAGANHGTIGVALSQRATKIERVSYPIHQALIKGAQQTVEVVGLTFYVPILALKGQVPAEAARPVGPVGIFGVVSQATAETVSQNWWFPLLSTAALIGTGLGVANLLPIPGLDGGRLLFVLIEAIRRKRINPQREGLIHFIGIAFLLSLVVLVSYFDVLAPIGSIDWGAH